MKRPPKPRPYGRPGASLQPAKVILVVTEGKASEPNYLNALCRHLKLAAIEVEHCGATDPVSMLEHARKRRDERKRIAKSSLVLAEYDEVWLVYDLEKTHDERRKLASDARARARALGIEVAQSDPCFELWLILHYAFTTKPLASAAAAKAELRRHQPTYEKGDVAEGLIERTPTAVKNADACRRHLEATGQTNPSTDLDLLVRVLNSSAREPHRFVLPTPPSPL